MIIKKIGLSFLLFFYFSLILAGQVKAVVNPLDYSNNKAGIHILDPNEVEKIADLVNGNGGDWGYVTVPLRDDDRDRLKWQRFMDRCKEFHLIPIVRLATVMTAKGWERPNLYQSIDFANFLNDLDWPTKNRYVIVYNEPNHATEWGGQVEPADYAWILKYTAQIFKVRNEDFFILPAGLDAAAPNGNGHLQLYNFINQMVWAESNVFDYIDGWTSHSYPNPGFSGTPLETHSQSIVSFRHESAFVKQFNPKDLPVFITETGWQDKAVGEQQTASFYEIAFNQIWSDEKIVAITPFLFQAGEGPFAAFSFLKQDGSGKVYYQTWKNLAKNKGNPQLAEEDKIAQVLGVKNKPENNNKTGGCQQKYFSLPVEKWREIFSWIKKF